MAGKHFSILKDLVKVLEYFRSGADKTIPRCVTSEPFCKLDPDFILECEYFRNS